MVQPIKYKKPRRLNIVSFTLLLVLVAAGWFAHQYLPHWLLQHDAYRVLEETSSQFAGRQRHYLDDPRALEQLRVRMSQGLVSLGIEDPEMETWIEPAGHEVRFGTVYSRWIHWPFDLREPTELEYEIEHTVRSF